MANTYATDQLLERYAATGFVAVPDMLPTELIDRIKRQLDSIPTQAEADADIAADIRDGTVFQLFDVPRRAHPLGSVSDLEPLKATVSHIMNDGPEVAWGLVLNKLNDELSNWEIPWHQDTSAYCQVPPPNSVIDVRGSFPTFRPTGDAMSRLVVARVVLDGDTIDSGCLYVIPGSHRLGNRWPDGGKQFEGQAGTAVELAPGDVLFFNPLLMHRAERNHTSSQRRVVHIYYRPRSMVLPGGGEWIDWTASTGAIRTV